MRRIYIIVLAVFAGVVLCGVVYTMVGSISRNNALALKTPRRVISDMPDTSSWQVYENTDIGFTFKFPRAMELRRTFPGRRVGARQEADPKTDPQVYDVLVPNADTLNSLPEVSVYVAPPGVFSCPPLDFSSDGSGYIDAPAQKIIVSGVEGLTRSGRVFGAATPTDSYAREVYVCTSKGYFRFSTPLLSSEMFAGVLSSFRFTK